jgi:two-component system sensor histidine kinase/response regulator
VHLRGDPERLRQVLINFVGNAIKFTERGEVVIKVSLESETDEDALLRFEVKDTGVGIPGEAQARLFQPFSQADGSTTRKYGGTGLGLAISKQLVELMHGQVGIKSTPGEGSVFWFTARLARQPEGAQSPSIIRGDLVDLHVLIVDDNETNRQILQHQTRGWKMRSNAVASAAEALDELRSAQAAGDPYQVVLLDCDMPGTDGLSLARSIRAETELADVPLVLLSSIGGRLSAEEFKATGIDDCLVKPVKQSLLFDCLATLIGGVAVKPAGKARKVSAALASPTLAKQKLRIILAEDNIVNQEVAQGLLRKIGYRADVVADGTEVLEALRRIRYDVILMDCQMPLLDGYETTRRIRQLEEKRIKPFDWKAPIHIIAMTAHAMKGDRKKCLAAGMNDYLSKPVRQNELKAALERCSETEPHRSGNVATEPENGRGHQEPACAVPDGPSSEEGLLDIDRLRDVTDNEPARMRRLIDIYLTEAAPMLNELDAAIQAKAGGDVVRLAHKLVGSSISCGVQAFTQPLRQLERLGNEGDLSGAGAFFDDVRDKFPRVQNAFDEFLQTVPNSNS